MRISDWSSDVCSSDLGTRQGRRTEGGKEACFGMSILRRSYVRNEGESGGGNDGGLLGSPDVLLVGQAIPGRETHQCRQREQQTEDLDEAGQHPHGKPANGLVGDRRHTGYGAAAKIENGI